MQIVATIEADFVAVLQRKLHFIAETVGQSSAKSAMSNGDQFAVITNELASYLVAVDSTSMITTRLAENITKAAPSSTAATNYD